MKLGDSVEDLNVYKKNIDGFEMKIWSLFGEYGDKWLLARVPLDFKIAGTILIEGVAGNSYTG